MWSPSAESTGQGSPERPAAGRAKWTLTQEAFDLLLEALAQDREAAAREYERLRTRLVKFFVWERCAEAESCADETLNRLAHSLARGEEIRKPDHFALAAARLVLLEWRARARKLESISAEPGYTPPAGEEAERTLTCLESCLEALPLEQKAFLLEYYRDSGRQRTERRRQMAQERGIDMNALRNRALRLRDRVEGCVRARMTGNQA